VGFLGVLVDFVGDVVLFGLFLLWLLLSRLRFVLYLMGLLVLLFASRRLFLGSGRSE